MNGGLHIMIKIVFVRHSEPDYSLVEEKNYITHGIVIRRFTFEPHIPFCGITEIDFDEAFSCTVFKAY